MMQLNEELHVRFTSLASQSLIAEARVKRHLVAGLEIAQQMEQDEAEQQ